MACFSFFRLFVQKINFLVNRIRSQIVGVEGKDADHWTSTTTDQKNTILSEA